MIDTPSLELLQRLLNMVHHPNIEDPGQIFIKPGMGSEFSNLIRDVRSHFYVLDIKPLTYKGIPIVFDNGEKYEVE